MAWVETLQWEPCRESETKHSYFECFVEEFQPTALDRMMFGTQQQSVQYGALQEKKYIKNEDYIEAFMEHD